MLVRVRRTLFSAVLLHFLTHFNHDANHQDQLLHILVVSANKTKYRQLITSMAIRLALTAMEALHNY